MLSTACCLVVQLGLDLVSGWLVVMPTYFNYFICHCNSPEHCCVCMCVLSSWPMSAAEAEVGLSNQSSCLRRSPTNDVAASAGIASSMSRWKDEALSSVICALMSPVSSHSHLLALI